MIRYFLAVRKRIADFTDSLEHYWEHTVMTQAAGGILVIAYIAVIALVEVNRQGWLPVGFERYVSDNHFLAVEAAFTLLLVTEVVSLIFGLTRSFSRSIGIQIEILALILIRDAFKKFTTFGEPIQWELVADNLDLMIADAVAALAIFVVLGIYYRQQQQPPITLDEVEQAAFIENKKIIALGLIVIFAGIGLVDAWRFIVGLETYPFFETFYTILIFTDVLMVLLSLNYSTSFAVTFRNFNYALVTVFIRLSLVAPGPLNALMGVGTALFALTMGYAYRVYGRDIAKLGGLRGDDPKQSPTPATEAVATTSSD